LLVNWWPDEVVGAGAPERELAGLAQTDAADFGREIDRANVFVDAYFNQALDQSNRSAWQRTPTVIPEDPSSARRLAYSLCYADNMDRLLDGFARVQALAALLACHAVIRRYRWELDHLPESLEQLHLGELAMDPFTGKSLRYSVHGLDYELVCSG